LSQADYQLLAEFRYLLRQFLAFSEAAAAKEGLSPQQHQALLAIKGFEGAPTVGNLAARLLIRHNTTVGLVDRLQRMHLLTRHVDPRDRRRVTLTLSAKAEDALTRLSATHRSELQRLSSVLRPVLARLGG
jgi:DNA-binding MarR family transcriptional regulator